MTEDFEGNGSARVLDPIDRISEVLFGLFMVLTQAHRLIGNEFCGLASALGTAEIERMRQWIVAQPVQDAQVVRVTGRDLHGAVAVFLLVFLSTFPVVLPFVFIADPGIAKRVSAVVAIVMLFLCGYAWGRYADFKPWRTGLVMVLLGLAVEAIVIALGG